MTVSDRCLYCIYMKSGQIIPSFRSLVQCVLKLLKDLNSIKKKKKKKFRAFLNSLCCLSVKQLKSSNHRVSCETSPGFFTDWLHLICRSQVCSMYLSKSLCKYKYLLWNALYYTYPELEIYLLLEADIYFAAS